MHDHRQSTFLLASHDPVLLAVIEPVLAALDARVEIVLSAEAALGAMTRPQLPDLLLVNIDLPGMEMSQLLAAARAVTDGRRFPIVLLSDTVTEEWSNRLAEGVLDDVVPRAVDPTHWKLRLDMVLRAHHRIRELEKMREAAAMNNQMDALTGVYNRTTLLTILFRETDRVQRMNTPLCLILFDIDDFGHWNTELGNDLCDDLLCQTTGRTTRLLRSYDVLGRAGKDEFLVILPGCGTADAMILAERLRMDVFGTPFQVAEETIRLTACFAIASSEGRSPVVVLRAAELALQKAKEAGPESIECFRNCLPHRGASVAYLSSREEPLAW